MEDNDVRRQVIGVALVFATVVLVAVQQLLSDGAASERAAQLGWMIAITAAALSASRRNCLWPRSRTATRGR